MKVNAEKSNTRSTGESRAVEPFSISRVFNAPRSLVYLVHTDPEHLSKWMSPEGFEAIYSVMDFKVGGFYHNGLQGPNGMQMWGKQTFVEIVSNEKLVHIQSFSDKAGGITRHPMAESWPLEMLATTTFEDAGTGKTKVTISWKPYNSDEAGNATFNGARAGMDQGFSGTFAKLESYLASIKS
ncbi:MAG: SRPBCC domain-containing protein [Candidatus Obscuribacterales bacterium]|nr:SRPBCC domain-containing protein [Candidatus Obscuribacterales bacterium]